LPGPVHDTYPAPGELLDQFVVAEVADRLPGAGRPRFLDQLLLEGSQFAPQRVPVRLRDPVEVLLDAGLLALPPGVLEEPADCLHASLRRVPLTRLPLGHRGAPGPGAGDRGVARPDRPQGGGAPLFSSTGGAGMCHTSPACLPHSSLMISS